MLNTFLALAPKIMKTVPQNSEYHVVWETSLSSAIER